MKRLISVLLCLSLLSASLVFCAAAEGEAYPESEHDYANNTCQTWEYVYPEDALGLFITFSDDTKFNEERYYGSITDDTDPQYVEEFLQQGYFETSGDYLEIYDANGVCYDTLRGDSAAGQTYFVSGNRFTLTMYTDHAGVDYGFRIVDVSPLKEGYGVVCYDVDGDVFAQAHPVDEPVRLSGDYAMRQYGNRMIVGWQTESGESFYYDNTNLNLDPGNEDLVTDLTLQSGETCTLRPIWCSIALQKEEVFSFTNSSEFFNAEVEGYVFTRPHFLRILQNWTCTFALSPLAPIAAVFCAYFTLLWPTLPFGGSCCGFAIATLLQHYGKIDLLSKQDAASVSELQPDEEMLSALDYYNINMAAGFLTNHCAMKPGTAEYSEQLHALYDTLAGGKPVYFELYVNASHPLYSILSRGFKKTLQGFEGAHGVVLAGAYTDGNGNHILIMYDNNSLNYVNGTCDIIYIDPDFTQIYFTSASERDYVLDGFSWNETFDQFDAFKLEGISNPFAWHTQFLKNFPATLRQLIKYAVFH